MEADGLTPVKPIEAELLVVTGMSGAGRSTASDALEDHGWYVVDNLPPQMLGTLAELVSHVSTAFTLLPGDVILTGTPAGVGPRGAEGREGASACLASVDGDDFCRELALDPAGQHHGRPLRDLIPRRPDRDGARTHRQERHFLGPVDHTRPRQLVPQADRLAQQVTLALLPEASGG